MLAPALLSLSACDGPNPLSAERTTVTVLTNTTVGSGFPTPVPNYTAYVEDRSFLSNNRVTLSIAPTGYVTFSDLGRALEVRVGLENLPTGCTATPPHEDMEADGQQVGFAIACALPASAPTP
jgi:hypothetical protein